VNVTLNGVSLAYAGHAALQNISLQISSGEQVAFIGPSGAGKTSLLHLIATALQPSNGSIELHGVDPWRAGRAALRQLRARIGLIHQAPPLPPRQRVVTAVLAGRLGQWSLAKNLASLIYPVDIAGARATLARLDLEERLFDRCDQLSGGQLQRVGIARVLYQQPQLILADEPVSALDPVLAAHTLQVLCDDAHVRGATLLASLHAVDLALTQFSRVIGLRDGRIAFDRNSSQVTQADLDALYVNAQLTPIASSPVAAPVTRYIPRC